MADSQVPQTNAVAHLLAMFAPQTASSGMVGTQAQTAANAKGGQSPVTGNAPSPAAMGTQQGANPQQQSAYNGALPGAPTAGMPVMNPQAWMQQGAGNFMPGSSGMGGGSSKGGQAAGGSGSQANAMSSILKMFGGG